MFRSATFKLTMWYLAIVMVISVVFSVVLYHVATGELARGLHGETQRIFNQFPVFRGSPLLQSQGDYDDTARRILLKLIGFNIIVLACAGAASYWLARRTLEPIEIAHEQQKRFTADVSHELRTPLTALKMESEVALMNPKIGRTELLETLTSNLEEAGKLETLINSLLRLTRLEADELQHNFTSVDTAEMTAAALESVRKLAGDRQIKLKNTGKGLKVSGDQESLTQLLIILLDNAIKYSPAKSSIEVAAQAGDGQALISVTDHGAGIEKSALEHVFDRFYRADSSRGKEGGREGFGLGLSIAKMIVDIHGGSITLRSRAGQGTTATISLPLQNQG